MSAQSSAEARLLAHESSSFPRAGVAKVVLCHVFLSVFPSLTAPMFLPCPYRTSPTFGSEFQSVPIPMVKILIYRICHGPAGVAMGTTIRDLPISSTVCSAQHRHQVLSRCFDLQDRRLAEDPFRGAVSRQKSLGQKSLGQKYLG